MKSDGLPTLITTVSECCGCGVCAIMCSSGAIEMKEDNEGFLYPYINNEKCVGCNICIKNCILKERRKAARN